MNKEFKKIKDQLEIGNKDIADAFGYKNEASFNNAKEGKKKIENGIVYLYRLIIKKLEL